MNWLINGSLFNGNVAEVGVGKEYATITAAITALGLTTDILFLLYEGDYGGFSDECDYTQNAYFKGMEENVIFRCQAYNMLLTAERFYEGLTFIGGTNSGENVSKFLFNKCNVDCYWQGSGDFLQLKNCRLLTNLQDGVTVLNTEITKSFIHSFRTPVTFGENDYVYEYDYTLVYEDVASHVIPYYSVPYVYDLGSVMEISKIEVDSTGAAQCFIAYSEDNITWSSQARIYPNPVASTTLHWLFTEPISARYISFGRGEYDGYSFSNAKFYEKGSILTNTGYGPEYGNDVIIPSVEVQTLPATNITPSNFTANGNLISNEGEATIVKRGFCYKVKG